ncbi:DUF1554 domain-containing protein [Leptospira sp. 201903070]|uniref:DUF1554 domain-containing protein n=1 Tax=Leptospira ainlahdjerensis TaxID=2810033 RepID=A0ABS2U6F2_9LEPT|nr:DUF1554 domain-containing protein [Leptospira ainlahdjerensis]MBM9575950.1 DUF1554 domain-containing protein [Leptospira ainlahdjerensis]
MNWTRNFFRDGNVGILYRFVFLTLVGPIQLFSCTVWPILTAGGISKSENSDSLSSASAALLMLIQGENTSSIGTSSSSGSPTSTCGSTGCTLFLSSPTNGNIGGIAGADSKCVNDAVTQSAPGNSSSYKALIMTDDGTRNLTNSWVLFPNTVYRSMNNGNLIIATTNANAQFPFPLSVEITDPGGSAVFTGIDTTGAGWAPKTGINCSNWTNNTNAVSGWAGISNAANQEIDAGASYTCDNSLVLYCVQK